MKMHRGSRTFRALAIGLAGLVIVAFADIAGAADVTASTTIQRSGLVLNRATNTFDSTVTITNAAATALLEPMKLIVTIDPPAVSLANATGFTPEGKGYVQIPLPAGRLDQGQSVSATVKISNPTRVKFTAGINVDAQLPSPGPTPPSDPFNLDRSATVGGIDANNDGVRDDIAAVIDEFPFDAAQKRAFMQAAAALQSALTSSTDTNSAVANWTQMNRAIECLNGRFDPERFWEWSKYDDQIEALTLNTEIRLQAYIQFEQLSGSGAPPEPRGEVCD